MDTVNRPWGERVVINRILDAANDVEMAKRRQDVPGVDFAESDLRVAVLAAVDSGISWQMVGDALGLRRGAAYQRFRRRIREE
ncbi:MAG: hypothetical protein JWR11_2374 [Mycobacterium sp.]|jgi:hypothetical protein|nr:hypothetical protein [Mycobacterium sp.]MDT5176000.1 hypothetical protein [Mycobacterium sp.]